MIKGDEIIIEDSIILKHISSLPDVLRLLD